MTLMVKEVCGAVPGRQAGDLPAIFAGHPLQWPEAEVMAPPVKKPGPPSVLVRRRPGGLVGPHGEELITLPGPGVISLFTGAGGMDIGLEAAGFCTLIQHEWMQCACETLIANRPNYFRHAALIQGDIRQTPTSMLLKEAGLRVGEAHIVAGGPPCQGFSTANTKAVKGKPDRRNDLVFEFLRVVREAQPRFFVMENVPGFTTFNEGEYLAAFLPAAYEAYYELVYGLCDAVEYGVPQYRCRFLCMGTRRDLFDIEGYLASMPAPENFAEADRGILQALDGSPLYAGEVRSIRRAPGIRYFPDRPVLFPPEPHNHKGPRSPGFRSFYDRLEREEPDRLVLSPIGRNA